MWGKLITSVLMTVAGKVITALGLSFVSYVGLNEIQGFLLSHVQSQIGGIPSDAMNLAYIAGTAVCGEYCPSALVPFAVGTANAPTASGLEACASILGFSCSAFIVSIRLFQLE